MESVKKILRFILKCLDMLALAISPMAILMLIICVIATLADCIVNHQFAQEMEQEGQVVVATVTGNDLDYAWVNVEYKTVDGRAESGWLDRKFYPELVNSLEVGARMTIRYLPDGFEDHVILDEEFDQVKSYLGFLEQTWWIALIAWACVIRYPDFLYIGYDNPYDIFQRAMTK